MGEWSGNIIWVVETLNDNSDGKITHCKNASYIKIVALMMCPSDNDYRKKSMQYTVEH